jgi:antitoxin PrlF
MIATSQVTTKGQVTLPKEMRDKLGIRPGHKVRFLLDGDTLTVFKNITAAEFMEMDFGLAPLPEGEDIERSMYAASAAASVKRYERISKENGWDHADLAA